MSDISTASVLAQIRALNTEASHVSRPVTTPRGVDFSAALKDSIEAVNTLQQDAGAKAVKFQAGDEDTELVDVMLSMQKAGLSFQAATEVRNRLVTAYQEIMNMPI